MDDPITKPAPTRAKPSRHRRREHARPWHFVHPEKDMAARHAETRADDAVAPKTADGDGGPSGRGPIDGDGGGRRPDRGGNDSGRLLVVLGIIALGAGVMSARLLSKQRRG